MIKIFPKITAAAKPASKLKTATTSIAAKARETLAPELKSKSFISKFFGLTVKVPTEDGYKATKFKNGIKISEKISHKKSATFEKILYEQNGDVSETKKYSNGLLPSLKEYSLFNNGVKYKTVEFTDEALVETRFFKNGNARIEESKFKDGVTNVVVYRANGTKSTSGKFYPNNDKLIRTFDKRGVLRITVEIKESAGVRVKTKFDKDGKTVLSVKSAPIPKDKKRN